MSHEIPREDVLTWYSPCGYEARGLFLTSAPIPSCPICLSTSWSTWPTPRVPTWSATGRMVGVTPLSSEGLEQVRRMLDDEHPIMVDSVVGTLILEAARKLLATLDELVDQTSTLGRGTPVVDEPAELPSGDARVAELP